MMMNQSNIEKTSWKLSLNQTMIFPWVKHTMIIVAVSVLEKDGKYYLQIFLHECVYKL